MALCGCLAGCVDSGTDVREIELRVRGTDVSEFEGRSGWSVALTRAEVAFGPVTLCPGSSAGEFCEVARGEWLGSVVVDAQSERSQRAGDVFATSGTVSSWMFDYGLVSLLTQSKPYVTEAARKLGGNSARVVGCATKSDQELCFTIEARVAQNTDTEHGVPVVRVNGTGVKQDLAAVERLEFVFEPQRWLAQVDFDEMFAAAACDETCEPVIADADSQAVRAVQTALVASGRPTLDFVRRD